MRNGVSHLHTAPVPGSFLPLRRIATPDLPVGACQRTRDALGKYAVKGTEGKQLYAFFFLNFAARHDFSRRSTLRGAADVRKTEDISGLNNSLLGVGGERNTPKLSIPVVLCGWAGFSSFFF